MLFVLPKQLRKPNKMKAFNQNAIKNFVDYTGCSELYVRITKWNLSFYHPKWTRALVIPSEKVNEKIKRPQVIVHIWKMVRRYQWSQPSSDLFPTFQTKNSLAFPNICHFQIKNVYKKSFDIGRFLTVGILLGRIIDTTLKKVKVLLLHTCGYETPLFWVYPRTE